VAGFLRILTFKCPLTRGLENQLKLGGVACSGTQMIGRLGPSRGGTREVCWGRSKSACYVVKCRMAL
jgi:hypothetical protein